MKEPTARQKFTVSPNCLQTAEPFEEKKTPEAAISCVTDNKNRQTLPLRKGEACQNCE